MNKIFDLPENIVEKFFEAVITRGKYTVEHDVNDSKKFYLIRRREEEYYKPRIVINNIDELDTALRNYITNIDVFYSKYNNLEEQLYNLKTTKSYNDHVAAKVREFILKSGIQRVL